MTDLFTQPLTAITVRQILVEASIDEDVDLEPNLPKGNNCQDLVPKLDITLFEELDRL